MSIFILTCLSSALKNYLEKKEKKHPHQLIKEWSYTLKWFNGNVFALLWKFLIVIFYKECLYWTTTISVGQHPFSELGWKWSWWHWQGRSNQYITRFSHGTVMHLFALSIIIFTHARVPARSPHRTSNDQLQETTRILHRLQIIPSIMAKAAVVALVLVGVSLAAAWEAKPKPCCTPDQWEGGVGSIGGVVMRRRPIGVQVREGTRPTCMLSTSFTSQLLALYKLTLNLTLSHPGGTHGLPDMQISWYQSSALRNIFSSDTKPLC